MRRILLYMTLGLLPTLALIGDATGSPQVKQVLPQTEPVCNGDFGTNVHFFASPSEAARQALKDEKLVFVLHVSGDFEDPDFT